MFGIGAVVRLFTKGYENNRKLNELGKIVNDLEAQQRTPFFDLLTGVERFDTVLPLLDAAFSRNIALVTNAAAKRTLVSNYLTKIQREYEMAKEELSQIPASRAEVAALGLALREISVALDKEIDDLRSKGQDIFTQQASRYLEVQASLEEKLTTNFRVLQSDTNSRMSSEFSRQAEHIDGKASENRRIILSELEKRASALDSKTQALVQETQVRLSTEVKSSAESNRAQLRAEAKSQFESFSTMTTRRLSENEGKLRITLDEVT